MSKLTLPYEIYTEVLTYLKPKPLPIPSAKDEPTSWEEHARANVVYSLVRNGVYHTDQCVWTKEKLDVMIANANEAKAAGWCAHVQKYKTDSSIYITPTLLIHKKGTPCKAHTGKTVETLV